MNKDEPKLEAIVNESAQSTQLFLPGVYGQMNIIHTNGDITRQSTVDESEAIETASYNKEIVSWGIDNQYPTNARIKAETNGVFAQNRFIKTCMLYGQGLEYYQETDAGPQPIAIPELDDFVTASALPEYMLEQSMHFFTYWMNFLEHRLNRGSSSNPTLKIKAINALQPEWSRISNRKKGVSKYLFYSPSFAENGRYDKSNGDKLRLYYPSTKTDFINGLGATRKFAMSVSFPSPGRSFYACAPWHSLFIDNSWLDVANDTPKLIRALHKNLITIKYVIHIPMDYWRFQFPKWDNYTFQDRKKHIDAKAEEMNLWLAGTDNQGKSFIGHFGVDPVTGKAFPGFKIEPVQDFTKHDAYLPNSQAANAEICYAMGVNPSVIGMQTPGGKLGAGSGSDIRVATNREVMMLSAIEAILLQPVEFVHKWNDWPKNVKWRFKRSYITTLDESKTGEKKM